jgi:hypothetical protein
MIRLTIAFVALLFAGCGDTEPESSEPNTASAHTQTDTGNQSTTPSEPSAQTFSELAGQSWEMTLTHRKKGKFADGTLQEAQEVNKEIQVSLRFTSDKSAHLKRPGYSKEIPYQLEKLSESGLDTFEQFYPQIRSTVSEPGVTAWYLMFVTDNGQIEGPFLTKEDGSGVFFYIIHNGQKAQVGDGTARRTE